MTNTELIDYLKQGRSVHRKIVKEIIAALGKVPEWRTDEPPRDRLFLGKIRNMPGAVMCRYCPADKVFAWAMLNVEMINGEWDDWYFETENDSPENIEAWMEVPE